MHPAERCAVERICNFAPRIKFPAVSSSNGFSYSLDQQRCAPRRIRRGPGRRLAAGRLALNEAQSIVQSVAHNAQSLIEPNLLRAAQLVCPRRTGTVHLSVHVTQESNTRPPTTTITTSHAHPPQHTHVSIGCRSGADRCFVSACPVTFSRSKMFRRAALTVQFVMLRLNQKTRRSV